MTVAIVANRTSTVAEKMRFVMAVDSNQRSQVERDRVRTAGAGDRELELPPAAHVEAHAFDLVDAVAEAPGHAWPRRQPVTVLRHAAVDRDLRLVDRAPFGVADGDADRLHLSGTQGRGRLERGDVAASPPTPAGPRPNSLAAGRFAPVPWIIIIAWLHAVMLIATARVASVSTVRRIIDVRYAGCLSSSSPNVSAAVIAAV